MDKVTSLLIVTLLSLSHGEKDAKYDDLQKEEQSLFKQIKEAVNDTLDTLRLSNDSEAIEGIAHLEELQKQFATNTSLHPSLNETEFRRKGEGNLFSFLTIGNKTDNLSLKVKREKEKNRVEVAKKLDAWLKIRGTRVTVRTTKSPEICPKRGWKIKSKKKQMYPCCKQCCKKSYLGCL